MVKDLERRESLVSKCIFQMKGVQIFIEWISTWLGTSITQKSEKLWQENLKSKPRLDNLENWWDIVSK